MKNLNTTTLLAAGTCAMIAASAANAAYVPNFGGTYSFPSGTQASSAAAGAYNGATMTGLTPSSVTNSAATTWSSSASNYRATNWATGATTGSDTFTGSIDLTKYISFTLAAEAGYSFDITSISFGLGRSGTGVRQWQWRSSVDNYAAALTDYSNLQTGLTNTSGVLTNTDTNGSWTAKLNLSGSSFQALTTVTFRLYGYNAEATGGTSGLQTSLTFVPAPGAIALLGVAGLVGSRRRR
jgi:MYXO-CTERM domain-containing protein